VIGGAADFCAAGSLVAELSVEQAGNRLMLNITNRIRTAVRTRPASLNIPNLKKPEMLEPDIDA
jgi:hypothetical protein